MPLSKGLKASLMTAAALPMVLFAAVFGTEYRPAPSEPMNTVTPNTLGWTKAKDSFEILSWNLQFSAGRQYHFFYDGGSDVLASEAAVQETLKAIQGVIQDHQPDILMLQEIDRSSKRTAEIDQLRWLIDQDSQWAWTSAPYFKVPYVPHPGHQHMGRVHMDLAILSRASLSNSQRIALPLLDEPRWRQMFNLKRALLTSQVQIPGHSTPLHLGVTHLSAFSKGDGTMGKQVAKLIEWIESIGPNEPWILTGDFNLLPPDDRPSRLGEDAKLYADGDNPITPLMRYKSAFPNMSDSSALTYLPVGSDVPDRKIDYIFYGGPIELIESEVIQSAHPISDHLPLKARFRLTSAH